ncbi:MAG TPA: zf-HC2 domain-containing protein [Chthonomonadaceae bacterium]|nr:zf-HC2 domain-containing protein [Chthonomonadaceae bacterium]
MNCDEVQDRILLDLEGELKPQERREVERHKAECAVCREAAIELAGLQRVAVKALRTQLQAPETIDTRVLSALRTRPPLRLLWARLLPKGARRWRLAPTLIALCLLISGYGVGYWNASRHYQPAGDHLRFVPTVLPDVEPVVRIKHPRFPNLHPIPLGRFRAKKV